MAQQRRILLVDDSRRVREGLRALLSTWPGLTVVGEASNGADALRKVATCRPDIVLMDVDMPVLDGIAATKVIKQRWPEVVVIVLTMYAPARSVALAAGADDFLIKGGGAERLRSALANGVTSAKT